MAVANRDGDIVYAAQHKRADDEAARIACGYVVGDGDAISATRGDLVGTPDLYTISISSSPTAGRRRAGLR